MPACHILLTLLFLYAACLFGQELPQKEEKPKVLLAFEKTRFKEQLIRTMRSLLEKDSVAVTVVEHKDGGLDKQDASRYDAVFITNSGVNSKVRPWVMGWLNRNKESRDRILLHTTQIRKWDVKAPVEAVTSASSQKKVKNLAASYVKAIKGRLGKKDGKE
ncbi:MAG: hypothetical protein JW768_16490 [Chitinispirillaceae bacterium]|nr:hypothetical protein [Chitinispirillaceae bacterium]